MFFPVFLASSPDKNKLHTVNLFVERLKLDNYLLLTAYSIQKIYSLERMFPIMFAVSVRSNLLVCNKSLNNLFVCQANLKNRKKNFIRKFKGFN